MTTKEADVSACSNRNSQNCSRFEFEVTSDWNAVEGLRIWFRKKQRTDPLNITIFCKGGSDVYQYDEEHPDVITHLKWIGFNILKPTLDQVNGMVYCAVEASGSSIHEEGKDRPFLVVSRSHEPIRRQRRSSTRRPSNCNCHVVDRNVSVAELNMQHIIFYPPVFNIKACSGCCHFDQSSFNMSYGNIMYNLMKQNSSLTDKLEEFWVPRCYPSKMASITILYKDNLASDVVQTSINGMLVESCACMSFKCFTNV